MALTLKQSATVGRMAQVLYGFLPGSGDKRWKGHVTFESVASELGLGDFWPGGSKEPAIAALLERTLERRRDRFERLIVSIVQSGLTYRQKKGDPVRREEIDALNGLLLALEFKFPDLWDPSFLDSLSGDALDRARDIAERAQRLEAESRSKGSQEARLSEMRDWFYALCLEKDRQKAGLDLERLLNEMFSLFDLEPRPPFRVVGEQIDGSVVMDHEVYLVEAKWTDPIIPESDLLIFREKIKGKSDFTRGFFISVRGFTSEALDSITRGKQPNFFLIEGYDLVVVLEGAKQLQEMLRFKLRKLTEEGRVLVSAREML